MPAITTLHEAVEALQNAHRAEAALPGLIEDAKRKLGGLIGKRCIFHTKNIIGEGVFTGEYKPERHFATDRIVLTDCGPLVNAEGNPARNVAGADGRWEPCIEAILKIEVPVQRTNTITF